MRTIYLILSILLYTYITELRSEEKWNVPELMDKAFSLPAGYYKLRHYLREAKPIPVRPDAPSTLTMRDTYINKEEKIIHLFVNAKKREANAGELFYIWEDVTKKVKRKLFIDSKNRIYLYNTDSGSLQEIREEEKMQTFPGSFFSYLDLSYFSFRKHYKEVRREEFDYENVEKWDYRLDPVETIEEEQSYQKHLLLGIYPYFSDKLKGKNPLKAAEKGDPFSIFETKPSKGLIEESPYILNYKFTYRRLVAAIRPKEKSLFRIDYFFHDGRVYKSLYPEIGEIPLKEKGEKKKQVLMKKLRILHLDDAKESILEFIEASRDISLVEEFFSLKNMR